MNFYLLKSSFEQKKRLKLIIGPVGRRRRLCQLEFVARRFRSSDLQIADLLLQKRGDVIIRHQEDWASIPVRVKWPIVQA